MRNKSKENESMIVYVSIMSLWLNFSVTSKTTEIDSACQEDMIAYTTGF